MKNLKELIPSVKKRRYTDDDIEEWLSRSIYVCGADHGLIVCIEEIGELINVIADTAIGNIDYIHVAEEIADVIITLHYCILVAHMKEHELKTQINISFKKNKTINFIRILSETQQSITKFLRRGTKSRQKLIQSVIKTRIALDEMIRFYNIDIDDIERIKILKIDRLKDRLEHHRSFL